MHRTGNDVTKQTGKWAATIPASYKPRRRSSQTGTWPATIRRPAADLATKAGHGQPATDLAAEAAKRGHGRPPFAGRPQTSPQEQPDRYMAGHHSPAGRRPRHKFKAGHGQQATDLAAEAAKRGHGRPPFAGRPQTSSQKQDMDSQLQTSPPQKQPDRHMAGHHSPAGSRPRHKSRKWTASNRPRSRSSQTGTWPTSYIHRRGSSQTGIWPATIRRPAPDLATEAAR
jgi:hypothetical protein